jgi:UTP:GlnB (protein PII) uridylyltransferase
LKYAYKDRTKQIDTIGDQYLKVINNENIQMEKTKAITESMESVNKALKTEMNSTFYKTQQPKDEMFSTFYKMDISTRSYETDILKELMKSRDNLKNQFKEKINAQNSVNDILKNYIVNSYDYAYMIQIYKDTV